MATFTEAAVQDPNPFESQSAQRGLVSRALRALLLIE
jgi:hypothetical protein